MNLIDVRRDLADYASYSASRFGAGIWQVERRDLEAIVSSIELRGRTVLSRDESPVHLTASAIILSMDGQHVLLNFHRKHDRWKHFGGHLEPGDYSLAHAAHREVLEETGMPADAFRTSSLEPGGRKSRPLDVKVIGDLSLEEAHVYLDVRFLFVTHGLPNPRVSEESNDIRWVKFDEAERLIGEADPCAVLRLIAKARAELGDPDPRVRKVLYGGR